MIVLYQEFERKENFDRGKIEKGATTFSITTLSIMTFHIIDLIETFSIKKLIFCIQCVLLSVAFLFLRFNVAMLNVVVLKK
jgi:hypothetical protein